MKVTIMHKSSLLEKLGKQEWDTLKWVRRPLREFSEGVDYPNCTRPLDLITLIGRSESCELIYA